jgi:putative intracellular protease/amidase
MFMQTYTTALVAALSTTVLAQGTKAPTAAKQLKPLHFGILLLPSVQPIDLFGPLDAFTGLAMTYQNITGKLELSILSVNSTPSTTGPPLKGLDFGAPLLPTMTLDQYRAQAAHNFSKEAHDAHCADTKTKVADKGPLDILIVPGGGGARGEVSREIAFVKEVYPSLKYIMSVCTGSTVLARAGVLDNKNATTNKKAWAWASSFGKNVKYQTHARWVKDGNVWTSSGVSAGSKLSPDQNWIEGFC